MTQPFCRSDADHDGANIDKRLAAAMPRQNSDADGEALSAGCPARCSVAKIFMALNYAKIGAIILRTCHEIA